MIEHNLSQLCSRPDISTDSDRGHHSCYRGRYIILFSPDISAVERCNRACVLPCVERNVKTQCEFKERVSRSCIARGYYCFHTDPYGSLQQIAMKAFCLVYLHYNVTCFLYIFDIHKFEKCERQSKTFNERIPKTFDGLKKELNWQSAHKMALP